MGKGVWESLRHRIRVRRLVLLFVLCLVWAAGGLLADTQPVVPQQLSLADAVNLALRSNYAVKSAVASHETSLSRQRVAEQITTYGLSGNVGVESSSGDSATTGRLSSYLDYENVLGTEASLSLVPYASGGSYGSMLLTIEQPLTKGRGVLSPKSDLVLGARSDVRNLSRQLFQTRQATVSGVIQAYCSALQAQEQVKIQERALKLAEQSAQTARRREEEGIGRGIDVYRAEVQAAQNREQLNQRKASARASIDRLLLSIGFGIGQNPELTDTVLEPDKSIPALDKAVKKALANRTELAVYDERIETQKRKLRIAEDELRLGVNAVASLASSSSDEGWLSGSPFDEGTASVGIEVQIPLDRRADREERDIQARNLSILGEGRASEVEQITEEVRGAYRRYESATASLDILSRNLEVARENLRIAERMVEEGEYDNREVLTAQVAVTNAESGLVQARIDQYLAVVALKYSMGEDLTVMGSK